MVYNIVPLLPSIDSSSSLAVVNCADYPDLCSHYVITHYPTVLLFNASPNVWTTCKGTMDSRKMLRALENKLEEKQDGLVSIIDLCPMLQNHNNILNVHNSV